MEVTLKRYEDNFLVIGDGRVREFLFLGEEEAVLIDTGFPDTDVISKVKKITDKPIKVVLTHADIDHTGGLKDVAECLVHPDDKHMIKDDIVIHEIHEGERIKVGKYDFEIIHIPGHTNGSIALWDARKGLLLSGDSLQKGNPIFMFGSERNVEKYIESMKKLLTFADKIKVIMPSHGCYPLDKEYITYCLEDVSKILAGEVEGTKHPVKPCSCYKTARTEFYY